MDVLKLLRIKPSGAYLWCKVSHNKLELRKIKDDKVVNQLEKDMEAATSGLKELPKDTFQTLRKKNYYKVKIERLQYDEKTGEQIGKSIVRPSSRNYNGSIIINDSTVKLEKPYIYRNGIISKREMLSSHGLEILNYEHPSPLLSRFMKMIMKSYQFMKR
jgi:hypothetical protein